MKSLDLSELSFPEDYFCDEIRDGFFVSETMKHHWAASLKVLSEIDKICKNHDINWYADGGTLIGAVRHNGYVPWDDDLDIDMPREEFEAFLSFARHELPENYCISYEDDRGTSRNPFIDQKQSFCGIANSSMIRIDQPFLDEFFGCPFSTSIDLFPLDRVYNDSRKEDDRVKRANLVFSVYSALLSDEIQEDELRILIPVIEKDNNISLGSGDLKRELLRLFLDISKECKDENSVEIALMYLWVTEGKYKFKKAYFDTWSEKDFETTKLRIPENYHEILSSYYGNYLEVDKGTADHAYPAYREQEKIYRNLYGRNPFRYSFDKEKFIPLKDRGSSNKELMELFSLIREMHGHIQNSLELEDFEKANIFFQHCQNSAISIGNALEKKYGNGTDAVTALEKYCETVYVAVGNWAGGIRNELDDLLTEAETQTAQLMNNYERDVLFLPCKAAWWDSLREVCMLVDNDSRNKVSVIPIPYYYHDHAKMIGGMRRDTAEFETIPELDGKITNFDIYNIEKRHPDAIIIQYPYDGYSGAMGIPELLYSSNLIKYTDKLIFVPYLSPDPPESEDDVAYKAMVELVEQPAVFNSDLVIVGSVGLKEYYINTLVSMTDNKLKDYWEKRIILKEELVI